MYTYVNVFCEACVKFVLQNAVTTATDKWPKLNRIITQIFSQITLKVHVSYGTA